MINLYQMALFHLISNELLAFVCLVSRCFLEVSTMFVVRFNCLTVQCYTKFIFLNLLDKLNHMTMDSRQISIAAV